MAGPAVVVKNVETPQSAFSSLSTGTAFIAGEASYGPEVPTLVRSLSEGVSLYGPRSEAASLKLYDSLNSFFSLGGARAYVNRVLGSGGIAALKEVESALKTKALVVTAKYKGTYGNKLQLTVLAESLVITNEITGEVLETIKIGAELKARTYPIETAYVTVTEGSNYATAKTEALKTATIASLATGANPTTTKAETTKAIEGFGKALGPGQLICPTATYGLEESVHTAMGEHAQKNNRIAICDLKEASVEKVTVATLTAEKGTYATSIAGYMIFTASTCVVQGVTIGTTRTVLSSAVVAGLCAQVAKTGNDNQAPAGESYPLSPYVLSFTNPFKQAEVEELSTVGINAFKEINGVPTLFGFVTALSREKDLIFWQASPSRERMSLTFKSEAIGNKYLFKTIDGRKRLIHRFQGDLQAIGLEQWNDGALFGETAPEAFLVNVEEPINTPTTIANGELNAELIVRLSPFANLVTITITSTPITEAV